MIKAFLFGNLQINYGDIHLDETDMRSSQLATLLSYFLIYDDHKILSSELDDTLWEDDEEISNPQSVLKNLMYRLRTLLKKVFGKTDMVITGEGPYHWNTLSKIKLDTDRSEDLDKKLKIDREYSCKELTEMSDCLTMYEGEFLASISSKQWVLSLSTYYHSIYLRCVKQLALRFEGKQEYEKTNRLCENTPVQDPLGDEMQYLFISSLMYLNYYDLAKEQYHTASKLLYERLDIKQSQFPQKAYMMLLKSNNEVSSNLDIIQDNIAEEKIEKAFYCEFGVFKEIYHLESCRMVREGFSEYVVLMILQSKKFVDPHSQEGSHMSLKGMNTLEEILCISLRSGDVISKYNGSQLISMLHNCNTENAKQVIERTQNKYESANKYSFIDLGYIYDELQLFENDTLKG